MMIMMTMMLYYFWDLLAQPLHYSTGTQLNPLFARPSLFATISTTVLPCSVTSLSARAWPPSVPTLSATAHLTAFSQSPPSLGHSRLIHSSSRSPLSHSLPPFYFIGSHLPALAHPVPVIWISCSPILSVKVPKPSRYQYLVLLVVMLIFPQYAHQKVLP